MMPESSPSAADSPISLSGLRVLVVGLGRFGGGVGVTRWLASQGAMVTVTDHAGGGELTESVQAVADLDIDLHLGGHDLCFAFVDSPHFMAELCHGAGIPALTTADVETPHRLASFP